MKPTTALRRIRWGAWLVLPVVATIVFSGPLLRGQVIVPADITGAVDSVWPSTTVPQNPLLSDVAFQFYPWQKHVFEHLRQGELPLWNPAQLSGTPFVANDQTSVFDPVRWLVFILGFSAAESFLPMAIIRLTLFGLFLWLFLRQRGFSTTTAITAAALGMVASSSIAWVSYPLFATVLWLPLALYGIDALQTNTRRGVLVILSATVGHLVSGNIQISLFVMMATSAYALWGMPRTSWRRLMCVAVALALGGLMAAVQLFPALSFIRQSTQFETGRRGYATTSLQTALTEGKWNGWPTWSAAKLQMMKLLPMIVPNVFGNPTANNYRFLNQDLSNNYNELAGAVGVVGLFFALLGTIVAWKDRLVKLSLSGAAICLAVVMHAPVFELINYLPVIRYTDTERLRLLVVVFLVILAAYGIRAFRESFDRRQKLTVVILASVLLVVAGSLLLISVPGARKAESIGLVLSFGILGLAWSRKNHSPWAAVGVFLAVTAVPFISLWNYNPGISVENVFPKTPVVEELRRVAGPNGRVVGLSTGKRTPLQPNSALAVGLNDVRGYEVVRVKRYDKLTSGVLARSGSYLRNITGYSPMLNLLSVRAVVMTEGDAEVHGQEFLDHDWIRGKTIDGLVIFENPTALPRAFVMTTVQEVMSPADALAVVTEPGHDSRIIAVETQQTGPRPENPLMLPATIVSQSANRITVDVSATADSYLILNDTVTADWEATVDGQASRIYPANYAFRAVKLTAGQHAVQFIYRPRSFVFGAWTSFVTVVLVLGWAVLGHRVPRSGQEK